MTPMAARLMHFLVARMNKTTNAVVASQATLGELLGDEGKPVHRNSIRRAIKTLEADKWVEVLQIGGKGGALAYVVNDRVAWGQERVKLRYNKFSAEVIVSSSEQTQPIDGRELLWQLPAIAGSESQLPTGAGLKPPSFEGMEPNLPAIMSDADELWGAVLELQKVLTRAGYKRPKPPAKLSAKRPVDKKHTDILS
jgi:hypothetical protein